jgi:hypothetical protein
VWHREQGESGLAGERPEREQQTGGGDAPAGPLDPGGADGHHDRRRDHAPAHRAALEQRAGEREHDRNAPHDHADRSRVGLAHALDHEQVEEHEAGGREGDQPGQLARPQAWQAPAGDRQQRQARGCVAQRLAGGERIALDEVGRRDQRANQRERGGRQQGSAHGRAHDEQRMLLLVRREGPVQWR